MESTCPDSGPSESYHAMPVSEALQHEHHTVHSETSNQVPRRRYRLKKQSHVQEVLREAERDTQADSPEIVLRPEAPEAELETEPPAVPYEVIPRRYQDVPWDGWPEYFLWRYYAWLKQESRPGQEQAKLALREFLIIKYCPDFLRLARHYAGKKMPEYSIIDHEDIEEDAMLALVEYVDKYDYRFGTTFMEFANAKGKSRVRGSILDGLRRMQDYTRRIAALRRFFRPMFDDLRQRLGREINTEDFCTHYGERFRALLEDRLLFTGVFNQYTERNSETDQLQEVVEVAADHRNLEDSGDSQDKMAEVLGKIEDENVRFVIMAYFYMGWIGKSIAEALGVSQTSVSTMFEKGKQILKEAYGEEGLRELANRR